MTRLLAFVGVYLVIAIPSAVLNGFVTAKLWGWFIAPLGAPAVSVLAMIGIAFTVRRITGYGADYAQLRIKIKEASSLVWYITGSVFVGPAIALVIGALIHWLQS